MQDSPKDTGLLTIATQMQQLRTFYLACIPLQLPPHGMPSINQNPKRCKQQPVLPVKCKARQASQPKMAAILVLRQQQLASRSKLCRSRWVYRRAAQYAALSRARILSNTSLTLPQQRLQWLPHSPQPPPTQPLTHLCMHR